MPGAIIFDFDGVIADTEPLHFEAFCEVLGDRGMTLSRDEYFGKYLGLNDRTMLQRLFADRRQPLEDSEIQNLRGVKDAAFERLISQGMEMLPGVQSFVENASRRWPSAICSGARRSEILAILGRHGLLRRFAVIVATDDVPISKPDPAGFLRALELLRAAHPSLTAGQCLAIEDSVLGIEAARSAGMRVLAVLGPAGHPTRVAGDRRADLADWACESLVDVDLERMMKVESA